MFFLPLLTVGFMLSKALSQTYAAQLAEQVLQTSLLDITNSIRQLLLREWEAEQDPQFRRYFYETLLPSFAAEDKIVIAVTHDDRWFHVADRVLKMEDGQLVG